MKVVDDCGRHVSDATAWSDARSEPVSGARSATPGPPPAG
jgi:hypothetical protein